MKVGLEEREKKIVKRYVGEFLNELAGLNVLGDTFNWWFGMIM